MEDSFITNNNTDQITQEAHDTSKNGPCVEKKEKERTPKHISILCIVMMAVAVILFFVSPFVGTYIDAAMYSAHRAAMEAAGEVVKGHGGPGYGTIIGCIISAVVSPIILIASIVTLIVNNKKYK